MTARNEAILDALEPVNLAARRDIYKAVFAFGRRVIDHPDDYHDITEILAAVRWHAELGFRQERVAFAIAAKRLEELP
jgi:hypothetical protein